MGIKIFKIGGLRHLVNPKLQQSLNPGQGERGQHGPVLT